ncbi:DUF4493 domain-containing protein [Bacteroides sp. 51]|uniref:DUF4493 domain-containing protein n=1 Tax=Bacteroides sp. 51 TaxID=2302938 RepID=UPI0013D033EA|nr:DUF4493 domain-containing protein [Bacteroides sp. 51]NDV83821.1 DUF4493 domain-containing protein [Bacteroides sp. 51]
MKRHCLLAFGVLMILVACSESKDVLSDEKATLYIASSIEGIELTGTRAEADVNQFTLILEHESNPEATITGVFSDFPHGRVDDVSVGVYELTLTSHPNGFVPAFEDPWYEGIKNPVPVLSGRTNMVTVECVQANAGITFIYDPSLEAAGYGDIVPEMKQDHTTLYFENGNREAKAYFHPKQVELRIKHGDEYLKIGGKEVQLLDLGKEQLWETTLKASQITGGLSIIATVKVISSPTHFVEFELGDNDLVTLTGLKIGAHTSSFLATGKDVTALKYGLFPTASLEFMLNLMSPEEFMARNGSDLATGYLAQLNTAEGLLMNFDAMASLTEYSLMVMPTQNGISKIQRYDFVSAEGIEPDPDQSADGPIIPGVYYQDIYQAMVDGEYVDPYENEVLVTKAKQENTYIVSGLFLMGDVEMVAKYNEKTGKLIFTGQDVYEYDMFNDIAFILDDGALYAGIYLTDGENPVDELVFTVEDRKLSTAATVMEFHTFDVFTEEDLGWLEISPLNNPFRDFSTAVNKSPLSRGKLSKSKQISTRPASSKVKGKTILRSSVTVLK